MSSTAPTSRPPTPREGVVFRQLTDEWVILDPETLELHVLNLTAALVWSSLDGVVSEDQIAAAVWSAFEDAPPEPEVARQVRRILDDFRSKDLLQ